MVFAIVALALIVKRYVDPRAKAAASVKPLALLALLCGVCIGELLSSAFVYLLFVSER